MVWGLTSPAQDCLILCPSGKTLVEAAYPVLGCDGLLLSQASLLDSHGHLVSNLTPVKESFFGYEGAPPWTVKHPPI